MTTNTRTEILDRLAHFTELAPDMRFGQLIANLTFLAAGPWDRSLWELEDEKLLDAIRQFESQLNERLSDVQSAPA